MEGQQFYDPKEVNLSVGGVAAEDFADGTMIDVAPAADSFESKVGTKGAVALIPIYNPMREVKVRVLKTSATNDRFSAMHRARAVAQFSLRDDGGTSKLSGKCVVKRPPNQVFSNTADAYEWTFLVRADEANENIGGNSSF